MSFGDRRRQQTALHTVATPPAPLLLLPASQSLTFSADDVQLPGMLMPMPQTAPDAQLAVDDTEVDSFIGQSTSSTENDGEMSRSAAVLDSTSVDSSFSATTTLLSSASAPDTGQLLSSSYCDTSLGNVATEAAPAFASPAGRMPPVATVMPLHSSQTLPPVPSVQPPAQWSDELAPVTAELSLGSQRPLAPPAAYFPVTSHWFFCRSIELRQIWQPFSVTDSANLELAHQAIISGQSVGLVSVDGGRYDVDVEQRVRRPVYWDECYSHVCRCSWFYRSDIDSRMVPYDEEFATRLEESYQNTVINNDWHRKLEFPNGDLVVIHSPTVIFHMIGHSQGINWASEHEVDSLPPRVVKRGIEEFENIPPGESQQVDHLMFVVHGIGPGCDLRFRNIVECVDDFRSVSAQMLDEHFRKHCEQGHIGRVEYLPVRWHSALHGDATGIDRKLKAITLNSIGKLRQFTNDTLIDVLFYGSPAYAQQIADTIGSEMNRLFRLFCSRNPTFCGAVSVAGHSLGSLIVFDLLVHQTNPDTASSSTSATDVSEPADVADTTIVTAVSKPPSSITSSSSDDAVSVDGVLLKLGLTDYVDRFHSEQIDLSALMICDDADLKEMGLPLGPRKKLLSYLQELRQKQTTVEPARHETHFTGDEQAAGNSHSDGDPLLRSASNTSVNFIVGGGGTGVPMVRYPQLIFRPCNFFALGSPVAMFLTVRGVDCLGEEFHLPTCPGFFNIFHPFDPVAYRMEPLVIRSSPLKPVLMPHHKGRKRLHLELRESLSRVGSDLKQRIIDSVKSTWKTINDLASYRRATGDDPAVSASDIDNIVSETVSDLDDTSNLPSVTQSSLDEEYPIGKLNRGHRVDYVLQEKPIESFNDYLFALSSHACYWESEDTVLMILKEIYSVMGVTAQKPGTDALPAQQSAALFHQATYLPAPGLPPIGPQAPPFKPHSLASQMTEDVGNVPMFAGPSMSSNNAVGGSPLPAARGTTYSDSSRPAAISAGQSPAVGPPPKSGFLRK